MPEQPPTPQPPSNDASTAVLLGVYQTVNGRRISYDSLLWQMPALSLTAQAFLFGAALAPGSSRTAQIIASGLAVSVSIASLHALGRFRLGQHMDTLLLERIEGKLRVAEHLGINPHVSVAARADHLQGGIQPLLRPSPVITWTLVLTLFGLAAEVLLIGAAVGWEFALPSVN